MARTQSGNPGHGGLVERNEATSDPHTIDWIAGVGDIQNSHSDGHHNGDSGSDAKEMASCPPLPSSMSNQAVDHKHKIPSKRSALRRHCEFWDADKRIQFTTLTSLLWHTDFSHDGLICPWDIYIGFRKLGFNILLCIWAAITMALCSSYSTRSNWLPDPLFSINIDNIHNCRHGSTTTTYDIDAELDMRRFDAIFERYADGKDYLDWRTLYKVWAGQCCANDWFGWFAGGLEWIAMYVLLWPQDGRMKKSEVLGVFDGTIFEKIARRRADQR